MSLLNDLLYTLPSGTVQDVAVGAFWIAVVVEAQGRQRCGLAYLPRHDQEYPAHRELVSQAGHLAEMCAPGLANLARSNHPMEAAIGLAAINALLPTLETFCSPTSPTELIAHHGAGKQVVLVGHFPAAARLQSQVGQLQVVPLQAYAPAPTLALASALIPAADLLVLSDAALLSHTFERLMAMRRKDATVLVTGPSTPLSPIFFDHGVHLLSGVMVDRIPETLRLVSQGGNLAQVERVGVRLVTMARPSHDPARRSQAAAPPAG